MMAAPFSEADRRRLLEIRGLHPVVPVLVLHPLLTVVTGFGRSASDSVIEGLGRLGAPLGPEVTGTIEVGGRVLDLPGALSEPDARPVVVRGPMLVGEIARHRAAEAAIDVSKRAARVSRREAALARRDQMVDRLEHLSNRADELEADLSQSHVVDDVEIEQLLAASRVEEPTTENPVVTALVDEWEALVVERKASSGGPTVERAESNLETIRTRIAQRESAPEDTNASTLDAARVLRVQEAHATVERLASGLEDARRGERKAAGQRLSDAIDAERVALAALEFESYASFLLAMAEGRGQDDTAHDQAALVTAEAALARARDREQVFVLLSERELDLRARVARFLGRLPGPDVGAELRSNGDGSSLASEARERLGAALRAAEVPVGDDPVLAAERYLQGGEARRSRNSALRAELEEVESEGNRIDAQLDAAENELAAAERDLIASVTGTLAGREAPIALSSVEPAELADAMGSLVDPTGAPVVIGDCFEELGAAGLDAILGRVGEISHRRQVIIVTEVGAVADWADGLGLEGVVWSPIEVEAIQRAEEPPAEAVVDEEPVAVVEPEPEPEPEPVRPPATPTLAGSAGLEPEPAAPTRSTWSPPKAKLRFGWEAGTDAEESPAPAPLPDFFAATSADDAPRPKPLKLDPGVDLFAPVAPKAEPEPEPEPEPQPAVVEAPAPAVVEAPAAPEPVAPAARADSKPPAVEAPAPAPARPRPVLFDREAYEDVESPSAVPKPAPTPAPERPLAALFADAHPDADVPAPPAWSTANVPPIEVKPIEDEPDEAEAVDAHAVDAPAVEAIDPVDAIEPRADVFAPPAAKRNPLDDLFADRDDDRGDDRQAKAKPKPKAKAEPKPKRDPKPKPEPKNGHGETEASRAAGPWKPAPTRRRKHKPGPTPPPWEGRFDTSRERDLPGAAKPAAPLPSGSFPLAVCVRHTGAVTRRRCARCGEPACDECLVTPRGRRSAMCIECAIIEAGVRTRRRSGG